MQERGKYNDIHPSAKIGEDVILSGWDYIGEGAEIGEGCRIANYCNIDRGCKLGKNCNLQVYVVLSMGTVVGDNTFFAGHVSVADEKFPSVGKQVRGSAVFGRNVVVGMGALVIGGVTIGDNAVIGMGAVVTKDIPANEVWIGTPAKFKMTREEYDRKKMEYEAIG